MTELDKIWSQMLAKATENAAASGRDDVADYLRLKATNDQIRERCVGWLLDTAIAIAADLQRDRIGLTIERIDPHRFDLGHSQMAGTMLQIRLGVRCLSIEAGWARTPSDGFMRNRALACARISHFGFPRSNAELSLVHHDSLPKWITEDGTQVDSAELQRHFDLFLSD